MKKLDEIKPLVYAIELRDIYTEGHSERVATYSRDFAKNIGLSHKEIEDVYIAGLLHDLGKVGIPDSVLLKPTKLEKDEFELIKYHSTLSAEILNKYEKYSYLASVVKAHHENYDGSGYPDGLKGEEIPLLARILAISDVFDALTTRRIYRTAFSLDEALNIMEKMKNKFDPVFFEKFKKFIKKYGIIKENEFYLEEKVLEGLRNNIFFTDLKTKLLNREGILAVMKKASDYKFYGNIVLINIKQFKNINKLYGLSRGDKILKKVAVSLKEFLNAKTHIIEPRYNMGFLARIRADRFIFLGLNRKSNYIEFKLKTFKEEMKKSNIEIECEFLLKDRLIKRELIEREIGYLI